MKKILFVFYLFSSSATFIIANEIDFTHDGWQREAYLYKPSCIPEDVPDDFEPVPLVLMFHGLVVQVQTIMGSHPWQKTVVSSLPFRLACLIPGMLVLRLAFLMI